MIREVQFLQVLPIIFLDRLAVILNIIELTGMWPQALSQGVVSLISKGEGSAPSKLRPISVMSVIYRAWAAGRVRDLTSWQQEWIADCLHGFRQGHSPEDVWWQMGLQVEDALLNGSDLMGFILDWSKCFDRVSMFLRARLITSLVGPSALHGFAVAGLPQNTMQSLRSAVTSAVWGTSRKLRSRELVFTLCVPGHLADPLQYASYRTLLTARRMLQRSADLRELFAKTWRSHCQVGGVWPGPVGIIKTIVKRLQWTWDEPFCFQRPGRASIHLMEGDNGWWLHEVREGLRLAEWRAAADRRKDCIGLDAWAGVDKAATCSLLESKSTSAADKAELRGILTGSFRSGERLCQAGLWPSPVCRFCETGAIEDLKHMWWHCPRWHDLRMNGGLPSEQFRRELPECTQQLGIFMEDDAVVRFQQTVPIGGAVLCESEEDAEEEHSEDGCTIVWTDGACRSNQDHMLRRAGSGVFYAAGHRRNLAQALAGRCQSNQRAELMAVILTLRHDRRKLEIRSDSQWVLDGIASWRQWKAGGWQGEHADLWNELSKLMEERAEDSTRFTKVKGHITIDEVRRGRGTMQDKTGNDGADRLAVKGAQHHAAPTDLVDRCRWRKEMARATHAMMLAIVAARRRLEEQLGWTSAVDGEDADRGSTADAEDLAGEMMEEPGAEDTDAAADDAAAADANPDSAAAASRAAASSAAADMLWCLPCLPVETDHG